MKNSEKYIIHWSNLKYLTLQEIKLLKSFSKILS
jgi:hypothetical protein